MAIKIAQTKAGTSTLASTVIVWDSNTVSGNTIVVAVACNITNDVSTITDSQGNNYVKAFAAAGTGIGAELWYASNILGGVTPTVTINYTSAPTAAAVIREYSGIDTLTVLDKTVTSAGNSTALDSGATTQTVQSLELLIGVGGLISGTLTAGGNFVNLTQQANATINVGIEDLMVTSVGTYNATLTGSGIGQWACGIASLRALPQGTTTSVSSTSSTSSSISSTSASTSSTSTSVSTTSVSTSSTSSSVSTSSTSSSISSTSASTSSTSASSTSASTSISSTSSSISSTSFSSTSQSSTSSSTSVSSTSSSFSSTSSSISSTSRSTSSTSFSSTSSSSSTSSTTVPVNLDYTYEDRLTIPATNADLQNRFTNTMYGDVASDDGDYFVEYGSEYLTRQYQYKHINNTDGIRFVWKGRSTLAASVSPILIQIYNVNSTTWETLARETQVAADVEFSVMVTQTTNPSNYYDSSNMVTFRSYQQVI